MNLHENVLIIVDPTDDFHPAVAGIVNRASVMPDHKPDVTLMLAIDPEGSDTSADNDAMYRDEQFIKDLAAPLQEVGIKPSIRISWSGEFADSILYSVEKTGASVVMVSQPGEKVSRSLTDEFWHLLRNTHVPVGIIRREVKPARKHILVAMDLQDKELEGLNKRIFEGGRKVAQAHGAQLHLVNAYGGSRSYPDRGRLVRLTGLPNENIHLRAGEVEDALAEVTRELEPDMLMIGATRRTGFKAALRGRKISRILKNVPYDIYVIV